jgi:hypothetical protein
MKNLPIGKETIDLSVAEAYLQQPEAVDLLTYPEIDLKGARHLVSHLRSEFLLLGVRKIDLACTLELKNFNGRISLPNLEELDDKTAQAIASFPVPVICNTPEGGEKIGKFLGGMNPAKAQCLVAIAKEKVGVIHTACFLSMDSQACETIISIPNPVIFAQIRDLNSECAAILAQKKNLTFLNLPEISLDTARILVSKHCESLNLSSLRSLNEELLRILLSGKIEFLELNGIESLTPGIAQLFASRQTHLFLSLNGLRSLSLENARFLMKCGHPYSATGTLSLQGIEEISPELADILRGYRGMLLRLGHKTRCDDKTRVTLEGTRRIRFF